MHRDFSLIVRFCVTGACLLSVCVLAGCGGSSSFDRTVNGTRTISATKAGVSRSVITDGQVKFEEGKIVEFSPGIVIQLEETNDAGKQVSAELRDESGELRLFVKRDGKMDAGSDADQTWLQQFFAAINKDDRTRETIAIAKFKEQRETESFLAAMADLDASFDNKKVLSQIINKWDLTAEEQVIVVDGIFKKLNFDKVDLLIDLIERPDFATSTKNRIVARLGDLNFESDREKVQQALDRFSPVADGASEGDAVPGNATDAEPKTSSDAQAVGGPSEDDKRAQEELDRP